MKYILATIVFLACQATSYAGNYLDKDGSRWHLIDPPARWFDQPAPPVTTLVVPRSETHRVCEALTAKSNQHGCAEATKDKCVIIIAEDMPKKLREAVYNHELAHCHGWPSDHPTD